MWNKSQPLHPRLQTGGWCFIMIEMSLGAENLAGPCTFLVGWKTNMTQFFISRKDVEEHLEERIKYRGVPVKSDKICKLTLNLAQ
jgi:hypothetical protein